MSCPTIAAMEENNKPNAARIALAVIVVLIVAVAILYPIADMLFGPFFPRLND